MTLEGWEGRKRRVVDMTLQQTEKISVFQSIVLGYTKSITFKQQVERNI